jgi:putative ABC transport system permease protein
MVCGVAALVVLAGSIMQGLQTRTDETLLFKVLGARQSQVLGQLAAEFIALGVAVSLVSVPLGLGLAWGVAKAAGLETISLRIGSSVQLAMLAIGVTVVVGLIVTSGAYRARPSTYLRRRGV